MINFSLLFMLDRPRASLLNATLAIGVVGIFLIPAMGALSDRIGRRPVHVAGALIGVLGAFPLFWAIDSQNIFYVILAFILVANLCHDPVVAVQQPLFTEMFEPSFRYSGAGFAYQLASAVAGGLHTDHRRRTRHPEWRRLHLCRALPCGRMPDLRGDRPSIWRGAALSGTGLS